MKKAIAVISIILCISFVLPLFVCADSNASSGETADPHTNQLSSSYIDPSVLDKLDLGPLDKIVKCYSVDYDAAFSEYSTFEEVLASDYVRYIFYAVIYDEEGVKFYYEDGSPVRLYNISFDRMVLPAYFSETVIKLISPDITVNNVYYLATLGATDRLGMTILYYETDMGNYVYLRSGTGKCLMPPAVFVDLMRYRKRKHDTMMRGSITTEELSYDLSIYEIYSENFDPHYLPAHLDPNAEPEPEEAVIHWPSVAKTAASVLIVIAVGSFIWWKRKRDDNYDFW